MKEIFQEYGGLIIAVILIGLVIAYVVSDNGFAAQLTSGISQSVGNLLDLGNKYVPK